MISTPREFVDVLIYDSRDGSRQLIERICKEKNWKYLVGKTLEESLNHLFTSEPKVIVAEVFSRIKDIELLRALKKIKANSVILKYAESTEDYFIYEKRFGLIYDFLLKSSSEDLLSDTIKKALDYYDYKHRKTSIHYSSLADIKSELEWMIWKEQKLVDSQKTMGKNIIESIIHSVFQGMGFGNIVPIVDLIEMSKVEEPDGFVKVKADLVESLIENTRPVYVMKEKLDKMLSILEMNITQSEVPKSSFLDILQSAVEEVDFLRSIKDHSVVIENVDPPKKIVSDESYLKISIKELLTNAFKFSPEKTKVFVSSYKNNGDFYLTIYNDILVNEQNAVGGIPPEIEFDIFEPFFKINNVFDERYYQEELGFGIGLTVVNEYCKRIGGNIHLQNVIDHIPNPPSWKVLAEISFPIAEDK